MKYKKGEKIIHLYTGIVYNIKYVLGSTVVVDSGAGYDMPISYERIVLHSSLLEELL